MDSKADELDNVIYSYTTEVSALEDENKILRETINHLKNELRKHSTTPLLVCEVKDIIKDKAIVVLKNGNEFYVDKASEVPKLKSGDMVLTNQKNLVIVDKIKTSKKFNVDKFVIVTKPEVEWDHIGGLRDQIEEIKEVIELPLTKPELFQKVGIQPPKGVLLYGPPGTGKTLCAKAVAASTNSTFIEVVGSELVQKFIGEGAKLVHEIFDLARNKAPAIVFIDEIDSLAATRVDIGTSGEREVQRTFMQLLAELDGFKPLDNVKIIGATNREDILDPAITRPGRLDRLIHIGEPDKAGLKQILKIHSKNMSLNNIDGKKIIDRMSGFTGAEVRAVCTEAGYCAIRDNRSKVNTDDFMRAIEKVNRLEDESSDLSMFG